MWSADRWRVTSLPVSVMADLKAEEEILVLGWMFPVTNLNQAVTPNNNLYPERYKHQITAVEHLAAGWGKRSERPLSNTWSVAALPVSSLSSRPHKDLPVKSGPLTPSFSLLLPVGCVFLCVYVCGFLVCECVWGLGAGGWGIPANHVHPVPP